MDEVAKVGGDVVTRIEGDAEDLIAYFDEQAALPGADPIYANFRALVDMIDGFDLDNDDIEITYSFRAVEPPAPEYVQVGNYVLAGEIEVPPISDDAADAAELIDLITAFMAASGDMNLSRVVGQPDGTDAAAGAGPSFYVMSFGDIPATSGGDGSTDFFLIA